MAAGQPARSGIDFSAFRDSKLARELIDRIRGLVGDRAINLMEVCGTRIMSPKVVMMAPSMLASAIAWSISRLAVTQTGQPGPLSSLSPAGIMERKP